MDALWVLCMGVGGFLMYASYKGDKVSDLLSFTSSVKSAAAGKGSVQPLAGVDQSGPSTANPDANALDSNG